LSEDLSPSPSLFQAVGLLEGCARQWAHPLRFRRMMEYRRPHDIMRSQRSALREYGGADERMPRGSVRDNAERRGVDMAMTGRDRIEAARQAVPKMSNEQLHKHLASGTPLVILDVREKEEWDEGHIPQATLLPRGRLEGRVEQVVPDRNALIVTH
jgi:hypothetical protein